MQQPLQKEERHPWRLEEDKLIVDLVSKHGTKKWTLIAEVLREKVHKSCRNGKQCRERWHNHLDPMVRKSPWNEAEEFVFIEAHKLHGNKWAEIAKMIPGRTDNAIKNHFYSTLRKLISRIQKDEIPPEMKFDQQIRKHTTYLSKYLKNLLIQNNKTLPEDQQQESIPQFSIQSGLRNFQMSNQLMSENPQFLAPAMMMEMGTNDLYVMKKLKESDITLQRIDAYLTSVYLNVVKGDNSVVESAYTHIPHQTEPLIKQEGPNAYFESLRHQGLPILGDSNIVAEAVNGITNEKIYKTDIEMAVQNPAFSDQSTSGKQQQAMSNCIAVPAKQEKVMESNQSINIIQYETNQTNLPQTMENHQNRMEEDKMDQKFKNGPQNSMAPSNNLIYSQQIPDSKNRLNQKIQNYEYNQMLKGDNKKYSFEKDKDSSEFQKFINEGDLLIIDDLKNKSEQLFREYNEAKEQELDQRKRQKERHSQYQYQPTPDSELSGASPISTLALAAAATRSNQNMYSQQLSVSPSIPGCETFQERRQQQLHQGGFIFNQGVQSFQTNSMQDDSGYRMVQFGGNNPGGYRAANQQSQFQEIYLSSNQNLANRSNYYNCQIPSISQINAQQPTQGPQIQYGMQRLAPYHVTDQNSPQQFVTINGERYLLLQPVQSPMTSASMINIDHHHLREDIEQSANTQSVNGGEGDHLKFLNAVQGQQFVYIPLTNNMPQGHQTQILHQAMQQENYMQLRVNANSSLRSDQPQILNFQVPNHEQIGMIQSQYNDGSFQMPIVSQSSVNETHANQDKVLMLQRQASAPVPSQTQFTHPSNQSGWRMVNSQINYIPRPAVLRPQAQISNTAAVSQNEKLQELVQNLGKIGEKINSEGSRPLRQIIKPQLIRNEHIISNDQKQLPRQQDSSPQSSLPGQIIMVPTLGHSPMNRLQNQSFTQVFRQNANVGLGNQVLSNFSRADSASMSARTGVSSLQGVIQKPLATVQTNLVNSSIIEKIAATQNDQNQGLHSRIPQPLYQQRVGVPQSYQHVSQPSTTNFIQNSSYPQAANIIATQQKKD